VKRRKPDKRSGYKPTPLKPLTPEARRRKAQWLAAHRLYLFRLLMNEAER